jgi:hypothetical protein
MAPKTSRKSPESDILRTGAGLLIGSGTDPIPDIRVNPADMRLELVPIDSVSQHPRNNNDGNADLIAESISELGFFDPITVQRSTNLILTGNHSWEEYRRQGASHIPAIIVDVDDVQAVRMMIAHNRTGRRGHDNAERTADALAWLEEEAGTPYVLCGTGYTSEDVAALLAAAIGTEPMGDLEFDDATTPAAPKARLCPNCGYDIAADRDRHDG